MIAYVHNFYNFYKLSVSESSYCFPNFKIIKELFCDSLEKNMKDPEFRKEWEAQELEYQIQEELIKARIACNMTQSELAEKSGIRQSNISCIENGNAVPRLYTLCALASAMGKKIRIAIV